MYIVQRELAAQTVKNPPAMQETWVQSLGWENPLEESMATHSSILARRIPTDRGAQWAIVHGVAESRTTEQLSTAHMIQSIHRFPSQPKRCSLSSFAYSFTHISSPSFTYAFTLRIVSEYLVGDKPLLSAKDM